MSSPTLLPFDPVLAELVQVRARGLLVWPSPADVDSPPWLPFTALIDPERWRELADAYARWVGASRRPVGGACALQHWSGDWLTTVLRAWLRTGHLLDLAAGHWWVRFTDDGAPTGITLRPCLGRPYASPETVAESIVTACTPVVEAVSAATNITARLAWGSVMTSCASVLTTVHHGLDPADRPGFGALVERVLVATAWPNGSLVSPVLIGTKGGDRLAHERLTCCLIRLGASSPCSSCHDIPPDERHRLMTAAVGRLHPEPTWSLAAVLGGGSPP